MVNFIMLEFHFSYEQALAINNADSITWNNKAVALNKVE